MIVGENARSDEMDVNPIKEKKLTNMRASGSDNTERLVPPRPMSLEQALEFIADDECVEVTPRQRAPAQGGARRQHPGSQAFERQARLTVRVGSAMRLPRLSPSAYRRITLVAAILLAIIIVTGGAVRLTDSGLGCPSWPNCEPGRLTAARGVRLTTRWSSS